MFNFIVESSLRYRMIVIFMMIILTILGIQQTQKLSVDVLPDLNKPTITIISEAGSLPPIDIERRINLPIEQALNSIQGVTRIRSTANLGLGVVFCEFNWGSDIYQMRQQVNEKLASIRNQLPNGIASQILPTSSIMGEVMLLAVRPEADLSLMQLREFADYTVRQQLLGVKGISQITSIGGEIAQLHVIPNFETMQRLNISLSDLRNALSNFSQITNGNVFEYQQEEYILRHFTNNNQDSYKNNYETYVQQLNQLAIKDNILLPQIATIQLKPKFKRGDAGFNGQSAVVLSVQKQPNTDTLSLTQELESKLKIINQQRPKGIAQVEIVFRQADFIQRSIDNLHETLRDGAIIVSIILILFTLSGRITLISLIAIPMSLLMSIFIFRWFNLSINTMTLGGLAIAMGELVDDAVIDVENINRRLRSIADEQRSNLSAILEIIRLASLEVRTGVVYATLIVILVCVPLLALGELEGQLFKPLIFAYIVSILASLCVAMIITPVLSYFFIGKSLSISKEPQYIKQLQSIYAKLLAWIFKRSKLILTLGISTSAIMLMSVLFLPKSFLPTFNEGSYTVTLIALPGYNLQRINQIAQDAEYRLLEFSEIKHIARRTGRAELDEHGEGIHYSELDISFNDSTKILKPIDIQKKLEDLPVNVVVGQPISHRVDHLLSGVRSQIAIKIFSQDLNASREIAQKLVKTVSQTHLQSINIEKQTLIPEIQIRVKPQQAQFYGLTPNDITMLLKTLYQGDVIQQILIPDRNQTLDLVIKSEEFNPNALVPTPKGLVPLGELADIDIKQTPNQINREQLQRRLIIYANSVDGQLELAIKDIEQAIQQLKLPKDMNIIIDGQYKAQQTASQQISILVLITINLICIVIYYKYQHVGLMMLILSTMMLSLSGGVIALWISGKNLDIAGMIGFITLAGISTRSSLLKISAFLKLKQTIQLNEALILACSERLIPVLMTTFSAMFALIPLILNPHEAGKEILNPVATVIFGGLISNLILDSLIAPIALKNIKFN